MSKLFSTTVSRTGIVMPLITEPFSVQTLTKVAAALGQSPNTSDLSVRAGFLTPPVRAQLSCGRCDVELRFIYSSTHAFDAASALLDPKLIDGCSRLWFWFYWRENDDINEFTLKSWRAVERVRRQSRDEELQRQNVEPWLFDARVVTEESEPHSPSTDADANTPPQKSFLRWLFSFNSGPVLRRESTRRATEQEQANVRAQIGEFRGPYSLDDIPGVAQIVRDRVAVDCVCDRSEL